MRRVYISVKKITTKIIKEIRSKTSATDNCFIVITMYKGLIWETKCSSSLNSFKLNIFWKYLNMGVLHFWPWTRRSRVICKKTRFSAYQIIQIYCRHCEWRVLFYSFAQNYISVMAKRKFNPEAIMIDRSDRLIFQGCAHFATEYSYY